MKRGTNKVTFLMLLSLSLLMIGCTNAFKDVQIVVNSDVFKYTSLIDVSGSSGASLDDADVSLNGRDVNRIFNMNGYRDFKIKGGILTFAVDPNRPPLDNDPVEFNVTIKKAGYSTVNIPVVIRRQDSSSLRYVVMVDHNHPPEGVETKVIRLNLTDGKVSMDTTIYVGPGTCTCTTAKATLGMKSGTQFKDIGGNIINHAPFVEMTTLTVDASSNEALKAFPGGNLTQDKVKLEDGGYGAGTLLPAGLIELTMMAAGKEVKGFASQIQVSIQLNPNYINPITHQVVKIGDQLKIFSYSTDNGHFQYETTAAVFNQGGHLAVSFPTTHLSWFMAGDFVAACNGPDNAKLSFKLKADWLKKGISTPVTLKAYSTKNGGLNTNLMIATTTNTVRNGDELTFSITPGMPIIIRAYDVFGAVMYQGSFNDPCSIAGESGLRNNAPEIQLKATSGTSNVKTTMQLYVRCPNKGKAIYVLPTFYLYFKINGASDQQYHLLGKVVNGLISSTLLNVNNRYDFKAVWGNTVKVVHDKSVLVDNTATVGDNPTVGELIGTKAGATNLEILKENCAVLL